MQKILDTEIIDPVRELPEVSCYTESLLNEGRVIAIARLQDEGISLYLDVEVGDNYETAVESWALFQELGLHRSEEVLSIIIEAPLDNYQKEHLIKAFGLAA